jgi:hypothetical protein
MNKQMALKILIDWGKLHGDAPTQDAARELDGSRVEDCSACEKIGAIKAEEKTMPEEFNAINETVITEVAEPVKPKRGKK